MATTTTTTEACEGRRKRFDRHTAEEKLCRALTEALEEGQSCWRREHHGVLIWGLHRNAITGEPCRGVNPALLEMWPTCRGYGQPLWITGAQARAQGWVPCEGARDCWVLRPQGNERKQEFECVFGAYDLQGRTARDQQQLTGLP